MYTLNKSIGWYGDKAVVIEATGPQSYESGGFTISTGLRVVRRAAVAVENAAEVAASLGYPIIVDYSVEGANVRVKVYKVTATANTTTGAVTFSIAEVDAGTDLSGLKLTVIAIGE